MSRPPAEIHPVCDYCHEIMLPGDEFYEFPMFDTVICEECIDKALKPYRRTEGDVIDLI